MSCPIDCVVGPWSHWSGCSKTCGKGTTFRTRKITRHPETGGASCPSLSSGPQPCNEHSCNLAEINERQVALTAACHKKHVRCKVKMLKNLESSWGLRPLLNTCGHSAVEETDPCWKDWDTSKCGKCAVNTFGRYRDVHTNYEHCGNEMCHSADADEKALTARLKAEYAACKRGDKWMADATPNRQRRDYANLLRKRECTEMYPFIEVMHDRLNMEYAGGDFKCSHTGGGKCECKCNRHPKCCMQKDMLLRTDMIFGGRYTKVAELQDCCNLCTNHPECTAWGYDSEKVCVLKKGEVTPSSYIRNMFTDRVQSWAGTPSGVGTCDEQAGEGTILDDSKRVGPPHPTHPVASGAQ